MEEIIFIPKYSTTVRTGFVILPFFGVLFIFFGLNNNNFGNIAFGFFFFLIVLLNIVTYQKKIIFSKETITVVRGLLPNLVLFYSNFTDIGGTAIRFGKKTINLNQLVNAQDLLDIFSKLIDERKIQPSQVEGKLIIEENLTFAALKYSGIPTFLLAVLIYIFLENFFKIHINLTLIWLVTFIVVFLVIYIFLKRRTEIE